MSKANATKERGAVRGKPATVEPSGFFALRTPLLPFDELRQLGDGLSATAAAAPALAAALDRDRQLARARLRAIVERPEVREALFVASPSLDESLAVWREAPDSERGAKVERTLVRYVARMCARPTPFGLFAGCSVGTLAAETRLELAARGAYRRHARLDCDYLSRLCDVLGRDRAIRSTLDYRPNASAHRVAGRLRYATSSVSEGVRAYHLVAVESTGYIEATLERARGGARLEALAAALVDDDISADDAGAFVDELVELQLLVSDLEPQLTGEEPLAELVRQLDRHDASRAAAGPLAEAQLALGTLDERPLGAPAGDYRRIADGLRRLPAEVDVARLFQVDLVKPVTAATLGPQPVAELMHVVSILQRMSRRPPLALDTFRNEFVRRYEEREVPLSEVLDGEAGIGFQPDAVAAEGAPLLKGLPFGKPAAADAAPETHAELLLRRVHQALADGADEIVLQEAELEPYFADEPAPLPLGFSLMATLLAPSPAAVDAGEFRIYLDGVDGPSGAKLLGRFCHADAELTAHVRAHLRAEEALRPDALFAEIAHLPQGRAGNIILRPLLRDHEIAFFGRSGAPRDQQIALDDLTVSVAGERVVLRSRRLGREIIPRLTSAHAFANRANLDVYRFLCALQGQDQGMLGISWGALAKAPHLPRLRLGRTILSLARWRLTAADVEPLTAAAAGERFAAAQRLRRRWRLPRWVNLVDGENALPIDLDNVLFVDTFVSLVKNAEEVVLTEVLGADGSVVRGPEGGFMHELVVPMLSLAQRRAAVTASSVSAAPPVEAAAVERTFLPGSEWLYAKIYTGAAGADAVLRDLIAPVVAAARARGACDRWHFVRYGDPDWHLRLRFGGDATRLWSELLPALSRAAEEGRARGDLRMLQLDTYEREIERYGGPHGIALAEALFAADSTAVLGIVATLSGDEAAEARWRIALRGIDLLLEDLGLDVPARLAVVTRCRDGFAREFGGGAPLARAIGDKFRAEQASLCRLLARDHDGGELEPAFRLLAARSEEVRPIAAVLREHAAAGRLTTDLDDLAQSFVHMHANRILRGAARAQERVLYDLLCRVYAGRIARARQGSAEGRVAS